MSLALSIYALFISLTELVRDVKFLNLFLLFVLPATTVKIPLRTLVKKTWHENCLFELNLFTPIKNSID